MTDELENYIEAKKSVQRQRAIRIFQVHLAAFTIGNIFFGIWNSLTFYITGIEALWFPMPLIFWGIGILIHYIVSVALFDEFWERDESIIAGIWEQREGRLSDYAAAGIRKLPNLVTQPEQPTPFMPIVRVDHPLV